MHISKITVSRLFAPRQYEHVRYEVTADLSPEDRAGESLEQLDASLANLAPIPSANSAAIARARAVLRTPVGEISDHDAEAIEDAKRTIQDHERSAKRRHDAMVALNTIGKTSTPLQIPPYESGFEDGEGGHVFP